MVTQEELEKMSPEEIAELQKQNCPFCKIVSGEIPSFKVFEDNDVLAILDINPLKKGHTLILPKEHVPIMPIIPPSVFKKLFRTAKLVSKSLRKAVMVPRTTIFIANGAAAGQQSGHFLFHVIPREDGDGIKNFDLPVKEGLLSEQEKLLPQLKANVQALMGQYLKKEGIQFPQTKDNETKEQLQKEKNASLEKTTQTETKTPKEPTEEDKQLQQERLAQLLQEQPLIRKLLVEDPKEFKRQLDETPELQPFFKGVDLEKLSQQLATIEKQLSTTSENNSSNQEAQFQEGNQERETEKETKKENHKNEIQNENQNENKQQIEKKLVEEGQRETTKQTPKRKPEVFLGKDPLAQRDKVFAYFEQKPKAKELLMKNPKQFIQLLQQRPDVQPIFEDVNIIKLSEKLVEAEAYEREQKELEQKENKEKESESKEKEREGTNGGEIDE